MGKVFTRWQELVKVQREQASGHCAHPTEGPTITIENDESGKAIKVRMLHLQSLTEKEMEFISNLVTLTSVELWPMTDERMCQLTRLTNLVFVSFENNHHGVTHGPIPAITDVGIAYLSELYELEDLYLGSSEISDKGLGCLRNLANLKAFQVCGPFGLEGLKQLASISRLEYLDAPSRLRLAYVELCPSLTHVSNFGNVVDDSDMAYLPSLVNLRNFMVVSDKVTDQGVRHLMGIKSLKLVGLGCPEVTPRGIKELQAALPDAEIVYDPQV